MISPDRDGLTSRWRMTRLLQLITDTITVQSSLVMLRENSWMLFLAGDVSWLLNYKQTGHGRRWFTFSFENTLQPTTRYWWKLMSSAAKLPKIKTSRPWYVLWIMFDISLATLFLCLLDGFILIALSHSIHVNMVYYNRRRENASSTFLEY